MSVLNKICLHWTGGANFPCETDLKAYHFCVDKLGRIYQGKYFPEDNLNCKDGKYAKHCGGGNTGCIGLSLCGMAGFNLANLQTNYPLFPLQLEAFCCLAGYLANKELRKQWKSTGYSGFGINLIPDLSYLVVRKLLRKFNLSKGFETIIVDPEVFGIEADSTVANLQGGE